MLISTKLTHRIGLSIFLLPVISWAAVENTPKEITKDQWITQIKQVVATPVCKGFVEDPSISERFKKMNLTYDNCVKKVPAITEQCVKKYYNQLPDKIDQQAAGKWGRAIGVCIGNAFAKTYLNAEQDESVKNMKGAAE